MNEKGKERKKMKRTDLEEILRKIDQENAGKRRQRRKNDWCFIPEEYYTMRKTRKELFLMYLKRQLNKTKKESDKNVYYSSQTKK